MLTLTAIAAVVLACIILLHSTGPRITAVASVLATLCLVPLALTPAPIFQHVGIAGVVPVARTFTVVLACVAILAIVGGVSRRSALMFLPFLAWLSVGATQLWPETDLIRAGLLQLATGVVAWMVGAMLSSRSGSLGGIHAFTALIALIVLLQVVVCLLQFAGVGINALDATESDILGARVNGTANHPNNLGKMLLLLLVLLLPLTEQTSARFAKLATVSAIAMFLPLALAQGRANFAAVLSALVLWSLLVPRGRQMGMKLIFLGGATVAASLSAAIFLARFDEDPGGGVRSQIYSIAIRGIPRNLFEGVGPNNYVSEISSREGSYIPVHNTFVLLLAETGLVGLVLFLVPLAIVGAQALRVARENPHARAIVSVAPGVAVVGWTGWGLLGTSILPLMLFCFGWAYVAMREWGQVSANDSAKPERSVADGSPIR